MLLLGLSEALQYSLELSLLSLAKERRRSSDGRQDATYWESES